MISHVCLGTNDLTRAAGFYHAVLPLLGLEEVAAGDDYLCWASPGTSSPRLFITRPYNDQPATVGNGSMIALLAPDRAAVDKAHAAGLAHGGTCDGPPGPRPHYGQGYYGAYLRDPDGNKLHLCHALA